MKLRSSIVWIVVLALSVSMVSMAAQRGRGNRGGGNQNQNQNDGGNPRNRGNQPAEGATREDTLRVQNKSRVMLEIVEMLQRRTGRPISYEDPLWAFEGAAGKPGDIKRTPGFRDITRPNAPVKDLISLTTGSFEFKILVDARSHLMPEPVDGSLNAVLTKVIADYKAKQLPGSFTHQFLGDVNAGGYGWLVVPDKFIARDGKEVSPPPRLLDYPISFPLEERSTLATFQLIADLVGKASGQQVYFKKLSAEATTGNATASKTVELPQKQFVKLGATNETARSLIAKALRNIERGDPRTQGPIPQRAWRLLYSIDTRSYYLDVVEVRQESYRVDGQTTGSRPVNWPSSPAAASTAPVAQ